MNQIMDDMLKGMPVDKMEESIIPVYQKHFTKSDIDALVAFYSSPTGQKIPNQMPSVMADAMQATTPIMRQNPDHITERLQQEMAQSLKQSMPTPARTLENQEKIVSSLTAGRNWLI